MSATTPIVAAEVSTPPPQQTRSAVRSGLPARPLASPPPAPATIIFSVDAMVMSNTIRMGEPPSSMARTLKRPSRRETGVAMLVEREPAGTVAEGEATNVDVATVVGDAGTMVVTMVEAALDGWAPAEGSGSIDESMALGLGGFATTPTGDAHLNNNSPTTASPLLSRGGGTLSSPIAAEDITPGTPGEGAGAPLVSILGAIFSPATMAAGPLRPSRHDVSHEDTPGGGSGVPVQVLQPSALDFAGRVQRQVQLLSGCLDDNDDDDDDDASGAAPSPTLAAATSSAPTPLRHADSPWGVSTAVSDQSPPLRAPHAGNEAAGRQRVRGVGAAEHPPAPNAASASPSRARPQAVAAAPAAVTAGADDTQSTLNFLEWASGLPPPPLGGAANGVGGGALSSAWAAELQSREAAASAAEAGFDGSCVAATLDSARAARRDSLTAPSTSAAAATFQPAAVAPAPSPSPSTPHQRPRSGHSTALLVAAPIVDDDASAVAAFHGGGGRLTWMSPASRVVRHATMFRSTRFHASAGGGVGSSTSTGAAAAWVGDGSDDSALAIPPRMEAALLADEADYHSSQEPGEASAAKTSPALVNRRGSSASRSRAVPAALTAEGAPRTWWRSTYNGGRPSTAQAGAKTTTQQQQQQQQRRQHPPRRMSVGAHVSSPTPLAGWAGGSGKGAGEADVDGGDMAVTAASSASHWRSTLRSGEDSSPLPGSSTHTTTRGATGHADARFMTTSASAVEPRRVAGGAQHPLLGAGRHGTAGPTTTPHSYSGGGDGRNGSMGSPLRLRSPPRSSASTRSRIYDLVAAGKQNFVRQLLEDARRAGAADGPGDAALPSLPLRHSLSSGSGDTSGSTAGLSVPPGAHRVALGWSLPVTTAATFAAGLPLPPLTVVASSVRAAALDVLLGRTSAARGTISGAAAAASSGGWGGGAAPSHSVEPPPSALPMPMVDVRVAMDGSAATILRRTAAAAHLVTARGPPAGPAASQEQQALDAIDKLAELAAADLRVRSSQWAAASSTTFSSLSYSQPPPPPPLPRPALGGVGGPPAPTSSSFSHPLGVGVVAPHLASSFVLGGGAPPSSMALPRWDQQQIAAVFGSGAGSSVRRAQGGGEGGGGGSSLENDAWSDMLQPAARHHRQGVAVGQ